ncbi:MAG: CHAD domain-containing protein [Ignavibacteria bacterium]|nr:CHAD domain-containing protein [Ignavibacteria bacterium]MBT8383124.1 CHAD domain-containing protein [Ignavibacteria bacterium]MBT8390900.1 CHAD domain-containing protein [Ignavibacteria bacterium]NNL20109.1 CHAD domain-containing protein [Ignavibacteriaceae bacterium]
MSYRLENNETLSFGLKRIILERIDKSIFDISKESGVKNEEIHDARKNFKKIRTVLRLVRTKLGNEYFQSENTFYRDAGRTLSALRDSTVLIFTFDKLIKNLDFDYEKLDFSSFKNFLATRHEQISTSTGTSDGVINTLSTELLLARSRIFDYPFSGDNFKLVYHDLQRIYEKGQVQMRKVLEDAIKENVHEWRKRVKDLWYAMRILSNIWPEIMSPLVEMLGKLSDILGDANDLFLLKQEIINNEDKFESDFHNRELIIFIDKRLIDLLREAKFIGRRIYSEKSKYFAGRMKNYFDIWRTEYKPIRYNYV